MGLSHYIKADGVSTGHIQQLNNFRRASVLNTYSHEMIVTHNFGTTLLSKGYRLPKGRVAHTINCTPRTTRCRALKPIRAQREHVRGPGHWRCVLTLGKPIYWDKSLQRNQKSQDSSFIRRTMTSYINNQKVQKCTGMFTGISYFTYNEGQSRPGPRRNHFNMYLKIDLYSAVT